MSPDKDGVKSGGGEAQLKILRWISAFSFTIGFVLVDYSLWEEGFFRKQWLTMVVFPLFLYMLNAQSIKVELQRMGPTHSFGETALLLFHHRIRSGAILSAVIGVILHLIVSLFT